MDREAYFQGHVLSCLFLLVVVVGNGSIQC